MNTLFPPAARPRQPSDARRSAAARVALAALGLVSAVITGCSLQHPHDLLRQGERAEWRITGPVPIRDFAQCLAARLEAHDYPALLLQGVATGPAPAVRSFLLHGGGWELRSMGPQATFLVRVYPAPQGYDVSVYSHTLPSVPRYAELVEQAAPLCAMLGRDVVLPPLPPAVSPPTAP